MLCFRVLYSEDYSTLQNMVLKHECQVRGARCAVIFSSSEERPGASTINRPTGTSVLCSSHLICNYWRMDNWMTPYALFPCALFCAYLCSDQPAVGNIRQERTACIILARPHSIFVAPVRLAGRVCVNSWKQKSSGRVGEWRWTCAKNGFIVVSLNPAEFLTDTVYFLHGWASWDDIRLVDMEYEGLTFVTVCGAGHEVPLARSFSLSFCSMNRGGRCLRNRDDAWEIRTLVGKPHVLSRHMPWPLSQSVSELTFKAHPPILSCRPRLRHPHRTAGPLLLQDHVWAVGGCSPRRLLAAGAAWWRGSSVFIDSSLHIKVRAPKPDDDAMETQGSGSLMKPSSGSVFCSSSAFWMWYSCTWYEMSGLLFRDSELSPAQ